VSRSLAAASQQPGTTRTLLVEHGESGTVGSRVRRTVLPGGLRVITESVPSVRSVTLGIWVGVGSRDEAPSVAGATHYLEHLLFKGTPSRTALDISVALDGVGGEMNAFTAKEYTCYHARVLDDDLPLALDVISDMVTSSLIAAEDVDGERSVILEEIAMHDDDPDDVVQELFMRQIWGDAPLGRPVIGSVDSINRLTRTQIAGYFRRRYRAHRMVVAAAGNLDHAALVRLVENAFGRVGFLDDEDVKPEQPRIGGRGCGFTTGASLVNRPGELTTFVLGVPGLARTDQRRYALGVLNVALGGGSSSRLFQEVRERRGLAYSVYSYAANYADTGYVGVSASCNPNRIGDVLHICRDQLHEVAVHGITESELRRGQGQLRGGTVLGLEDTGSRMSRLAKAELVYGELPSVTEVLARVDAVTLQDVREVAAETLASAPALAVVGPFNDVAPFEAAIG
jgi:predicted Zn-dependent peptidase